MMSETNSPTNRFEELTVTVIIPYCEAFTPREMLEEAIESANDQVGVDIEVLVVEDEDQRGPAWARNEGLDCAETRYVAFLDADDVWEETKTVRQLERMEETGAGICVEGNKERTPIEFMGAILRSDIFGLTSSILLDTEKVETRFEETLVRREDHLFMIEAAMEGDICFVSDTFSARKYEEGFSKHVEKSPEEVDEFYETLVDRVPEAEQFKREYYQDSYVYLGRTRHYEGEYWAAIHYYLESMSIGFNMKAFGAIALACFAAVFHGPLRTGREIIAR